MTIASDRGTNLAATARQPNQVGWRPTFFRLSDELDCARMRSLLRPVPPPPQVFDSVLAQLRDLIRTREPARRYSDAELESLARDHLGGRPVDEYGVWVYYPWSARLVHLLDERDFIELRTNRNRNKITAAQQARLASKRVGVVGLSVGQSIAATLALERSAGELRLADFDRVDLSNMNRLRTGVHSIDLPKVLVTAREIAEIDPFLRMEIFPDGITENNVDEFLLRCGKLDLLVDECDSLDIKILVRQRAKELGIPVVMATSDKGMLDIERFDVEPGRPIFHGLAGDLDPLKLKGLTAAQKVPHVAKLLGLRDASIQLRASLLEVEQTITTWPQLACDISAGAGSAADIVRRILLGELVVSGRFYFEHRKPEEVQDPPSTVKATVTTGTICQDRVIRDIVADAVLAPSGGNAQPWKWVAGKNQIDLFVDVERSSYLDFESRGSFTALGCAAENLILAVHHAGMEVNLEPFPAWPHNIHTATFRLLPAGSANCEPHWRDELYQQIAVRHTNRRIGVRQVLGSEVLADFTAAVRSILSVEVQWLTSDSDLERIGELIGIADRLRLLSPLTNSELFSELRWTENEALVTGDGIDVDTLELSPSDRVGLEIIRDRQVLELVRSWGQGRKLEEQSRRAIRASSAVGLVVAPNWHSPDYFNAGRAFQRLWLTATKQNVSVQPMTALPYLMARLKRDGGEGVDDEMARELARMRPCWEQLFNNPPDAGEVMLFRVCLGADTDRRSLRRPLDQVLSGLQDDSVPGHIGTSWPPDSGRRAP